MIVGLLWLLGCQAVGEVVVRQLDLPVPGPVVGLLLLLGVLRLRRTPARPAAGEAADPILAVSDVLLRHLQLFFVPAGVGVVAYAAVIRDDALPLTVALVGSWLLGLLVVGLTLELVVRRRAARAARAAGA